MNVAGPLASLIFAVTVLTVFGGLFAYGVYKARERTRRKPTGRKELQYFVEYTVPIADGAGATEAMAAPAAGGAPWALWALSAFALVGFFAASVHYYRSGRRIVLQGAWARAGSGPNREFPGPPDRTKFDRGPELVLAKPRGRVASLAPRPRYDADGNGVLSAAERARLHAEVPLTVLLVVDDNGHTQGLRWLYDTLEKRGIWGKTTFFLTGNYAEGHPNYLGGPVTAWWSTLAQDGWIGIHGLTHASSTEGWTADRWRDENASVLGEIGAHVSPPAGWTWASYPFGSRAPYLSFTDAYFAGLDVLVPRVVYDVSMVVHPSAAPPVTERDESWPFSLDTPLPGDVELPYSVKLGHRIEVGSHPILEVPVYAWAVRPEGAQAYKWVPSLDANYFDAYPCKGESASAAGIEAFEENLKAHYRGNRAPFHIGLHAQNYTADKHCERASFEAMLATVDRLRAAGYDIQYEGVPRLLEWLTREAP